MVANHTSGADPLLVQAALPFEPRWLMAEDMRVERFDGFWAFSRVIFVSREGGELAGLREALRHLRAGRPLGIFPEGNIERPPRRILPFRPGVGFLVARGRARVLPVIVDGTPQVDPAWASLVKRSRSTVRFLPVVEYAASGLDAEGINADLRRRFAEATGWPTSERTPVIGAGRRLLVGVDGRYRDESGAPITDEQAEAVRREIRGAGDSGGDGA